MAMNVLQLQARIKEMPDEALGQLMQTQSPEVPGYLVLAELNNRKRLRNAAPEPGAIPGPNMKEEALMMTRGDMGQQVRSFAEGGAVAPFGALRPQAAAPSGGPFIPPSAQGSYNGAMSSIYSGAQTPPQTPSQPMMPSAPAQVAPVGVPQMGAGYPPRFADGGEVRPGWGGYRAKKGGSNGASSDKTVPQTPSLGGSAADYKLFSGGPVPAPARKRYAAGGAVNGLMPLSRGPDGKVRFGE